MILLLEALYGLIFIIPLKIKQKSHRPWRNQVKVFITTHLSHSLSWTFLDLQIYFHPILLPINHHHHQPWTSQAHSPVLQSKYHHPPSRAHANVESVSLAGSVRPGDALALVNGPVRSSPTSASYSREILSILVSLWPQLDLSGQACVMRGEASVCDWRDAKPLIVHGRLAEPSITLPTSSRPAPVIRHTPTTNAQEQLRISNDLRSLSDRVDRMVNLLQRAPKTPHGSVLEDGRILSQNPHYRLSESSSSVRPTISSVPDTVPVSNYHADDLATQLGRFTLSQAIRDTHMDGFRVLDPDLVPTNPLISVTEVREFLDESFNFFLNSNEIYTTS